MSKRLITLRKAELVYLKEAIELAVKRKFPGRPESYRELDREDRINLGEAIPLGWQRLDQYVNAGEEVTCYPASLKAICIYIGEDSWASFVAKKRAETVPTTAEPGTNIPASPDPPFPLSAEASVSEQVYAPIPETATAVPGYSHKKPIKAIVAAIFFLIALAVVGFMMVTRKMSHANVGGTMIVSAVTFVLDAPVMVDKIGAGSYIRIDSATLYGAPFLDGIERRLVARVNGRQQETLEQFSVPAGIRVSIETPLKDQLFIKLLAVNPDDSAQLEGKLSGFDDLVIDKTTVIPSDSITSSTKAVRFLASLKKDESFELAIVGAGVCDIPWMVVKEIRFQEKGDFYDVKPRSSVKRGAIAFTEIGDSIRLEAFDDLTVTPFSPLRLLFTPVGDGIRVAFSGDVRDLSIGSETLRKPATSLMPRSYATMGAAPIILGACIFIALAITTFILILRKQQLEK